MVGRKEQDGDDAMFVARLTGEADGYVISREFEQEGAAVSWLQREGLAQFEDQTARGEVWNGNTVVWARSNLQTREQRDRNARREAVRLLARLNLSDKGRR
jgi:hypothetical protein